MLSVNTDDPNFRTALALASQAVAGTLPDITGGADHYHTKQIEPSWISSGQQVADLGNHLFYQVA